MFPFSCLLPRFCSHLCSRTLVHNTHTNPVLTQNSTATSQSDSFWSVVRMMWGARKYRHLDNTSDTQSTLCLFQHTTMHSQAQGQVRAEAMTPFSMQLHKLLALLLMMCSRSSGVCIEGTCCLSTGWSHGAACIALLATLLHWGEPVPNSCLCCHCVLLLQ